MKQKVSPATDIVQRAQAGYPKNLAAVQSYFGPIPYGQQKVSRQTADRGLAQLTPMDLANLSMTNPAAAETAAQRLQVIQDKAAALPPLPASDQYEGR